jgi:voltage-dependent potassium channel beta subunit
MGSTGIKISAISIGAWLTYGSEGVDFKVAADCLRTAIDCGINFIDVADVYANGKAEETVGKVLADYDRTKLVISSKAYWPMSDDVNDRGLSRKHLMESVHKSLKRLGTDYLDIFFCHRYDPDTATEETVRALDDLIRQGKILYWGTSMWEAAQIREAVSAADRYYAYRPVVEQPLYNMLDRHVVEGELEDVLAEYGIGIVVFSPLAQGVLTGKYNDGIPSGSRADTIEWVRKGIIAERVEKAKALSELAKELDVTPSNLALAWALKHPNVDSVITGATKPQQVEDNVRALEVRLTPELENRIEAILQNRPYGSKRIIENPMEMPAL